jgi:hypothetical protein
MFIHMTLRTKIEIVLASLAIAFAAFAFQSWLEARDDRVKMQATIAAQSQLISEQKQQAAALAEQEKTRDAALQSRIAAMQKSVAAIATPQQIAAWIPAQVKTPAPITIQGPAAPAASGQQGTGKNPATAPPATATIPQIDLPSLRDYVEACKECQARLATSTQDLASKDRQLKLAADQLTATARQRDAAITAAKGGSFWTRLKRNAHWLAIGAGVGAAAVCASGHCR